MRIENIKREKVWIDPKIVSGSYKHVSNSRAGVKYCLYRDKRKTYLSNDPTEEFSTSWVTGWCFGDLLRKLYENSRKNGKIKRVNKLYYKMELVPACITLTKKEKTRYIRLAVQNKFLPKYVKAKTVVENNALVIDLEGLTQAQLYVYLCTFRFLREDPGVVRSLVHLVDKHGMDFYAAYVVSCKVALNYDVHNFITTVRRYGSSPDLVNTTTDIPLSTIVSVRRFVNDPWKYDATGVYESNSRFKGYSIIESISKLEWYLSVDDLFDVNVVKSLSLDNDSDINKNMKDYFRSQDKLKSKGVTT